MRIARPDSSEYDNIQRFLEDVYGHAFNYFSSCYPRVWKKQYADFTNIFVLKDRGKIVSLVRIFPLETVQDGINMNLAGIGAVSTDYRCRGKGYMTELLHYSFKEMERQEFPLSVLGGDRHRYGNFGYENGGRVVDVTVSARGLKNRGMKSVDTRRCGDCDRKNLARMMKVYNSLRYRTERTIDGFQEICRRLGTAVYYAGEGDRFAYVAVNATEIRDGSRRILEFAGSDETAMGILMHLGERFGFTSFSLSFPEFHEIPEDILTSASSWNVYSAMMIKIISLKDTLRQFSKQRDFSFPDGEEITLTIRNKESAVISKKSGVLRIHGGRGRNEAAMNETEMVRLLFGISFRAPAGTEKTTLQLLKTFLPFNLYLGHLDHI